MRSMTKQQVLDEAMKLGLKDRRDLAEAIYDSTGIGDEMSDEWAAEIQRRVDQIDRGEATLIDGDEAIRQARAALKQRRAARAS